MNRLFIKKTFQLITAKLFHCGSATLRNYIYITFINLKINTSVWLFNESKGHLCCDRLIAERVIFYYEKSGSWLPRLEAPPPMTARFRDTATLQEWVCEGLNTGSDVKHQVSPPWADQTRANDRSAQAPAPILPCKRRSAVWRAIRQKRAWRRCYADY